jgi:hypothetical protein
MRNAMRQAKRVAFQRKVGVRMINSVKGEVNRIG